MAIDEGEQSASRHSSEALSDEPLLEKADWETQRRPTSRRLLALWLSVLALTVLSLTGLLLGSVPSLASQAAEKPNAHADASQSEPLDHIQYAEDIPTTPSWRSNDEYTLSQAWDFDAKPTTREYDWTIADTVFNPDGVYRPMILINNQFPGPLLVANDGDTIVVHIRNRATNATSIHFHGMYQNGTNAMDGTVGVTQCPIAPGSDYTYRFRIRGQSGTYWYHAHHSAQASDGILGPFVIHSPLERSELQKLEYSSDRVLMIQDHYHNTTAELLMDYLQPRKENEEPVPESALINGRGVRSCAEFPGWSCDDSMLAYPEIHLTRGRRHRLRIINVGAFAEFIVQVDEHPFHVTEVDGTDVTHEQPIHRLEILPAQRYSIVLEAGMATGLSLGRKRHSQDHEGVIGGPGMDSFWLRAGMQTACFTAEQPYLNTDIRAIIRYVDEDEDGHHVIDTAVIKSLPKTESWDEINDPDCRDLDTSILTPVVPIRPPPADDYILLRASFRIGAWRLSRGFFNDTSWHPNVTYPTLHRFLVEADPENKPASKHAPRHPDAAVSLAESTFYDPSDEFILQTNNGIRTIDIAINNFDDGAHPFHLHGHKFFVLTPSLTGYPPATKEEVEGYLSANVTRAAMYENPLRRDTVTVSAFEWVIVRVVLDNPGLWALHCHNIWHGEAGMAMQFLVRKDELVKQQPGVGQLEREMCKREGVMRGVRPDDSLWFGSFD